MDEYEDKYSIEKLHPHYDTEIRYYEEKLNELSIRFTEAKEINNFVQYSEIKEDGYKLLMELFESNAMKYFKNHLTQSYISSKNNEVSQTLNKIFAGNSFESVHFNFHISIKIFLILPYWPFDIELYWDWRLYRDRDQR